MQTTEFLIFELKYMDMLKLVKTTNQFIMASSD